MASPRHQFSLRRLLGLTLAWGVGLAGVRLLHFGPWTIGCALMYGAFATLLILLSSQRIWKFWCLSLVCVTFAAAIFALACLNGVVPRGLQESLTPAKQLAEEQRLVHSGNTTMFASLLIWPLLTGIIYSPGLALLIALFALRSGLLKLRVVAIGGIIALLIVVWFASVDWWYFIEGCPDCGFHHTVLQYRLCGHPLNTTFHNPYHPIAEHVARDLGIPCSHPRMDRMEIQRWRGLCFCTSPCANPPSFLIAYDGWYDTTVQVRIQALVAQDPTVRDEFRRRIMIDRDATWWGTFWPRVGVTPKDSP
ncbi:MAG: hypothetical protein K8T91_04035 [Planctomycetes bacterium]|nr:hypothetical protein [Planctomycetota bacterium]